MFKPKNCCLEITSEENMKIRGGNWWNNVDKILIVVKPGWYVIVGKKTVKWTLLTYV